MTLIETTFRKAIQKLDYYYVESCVKEGLIKESYNIECKTIDYDLKELDDKSKEEQILKPVIAMLNSPSGSGLVCIGIKAKKQVATKLLPIKKSVIKNEEQLEDIISGNLDSMPKYHDKYNINTVKIDKDEDSSIFLIEIKKVSQYSLFFSSLSNKAYIRENDKSRSLSPPEILDYITKINLPHVFLKLGKEQGLKHAYRFELFYINEGFKPARNVKTIIVIPKNDLNIELIGFRSRKIQFVDHKKIEQNGDYTPYLAESVLDDEIKSQDDLSIYETIMAPDLEHRLVYPSIPFPLGLLEIKKGDKDFTLSIHTITYENDVLTRQKIILSRKRQNFNTEYKKKEITPYINL